MPLTSWVSFIEREILKNIYGRLSRLSTARRCYVFQPEADFIKGFAPLCPAFAPCAQLFEKLFTGTKVGRKGVGRKKSL